MKCPRCKKQLRKGAKFCPACGARVEKRRGIRFTSILLVIVLLLSIVAIGWSGGILFAKYFGDRGFLKLFSAFSKDANTTFGESYSITAPDAESFFENNSTVISVIDAAKSEMILTEAEVYNVLSSRGFTQYSITSSYSMTGEYSDARDINETALHKHPIYETYHISENGDIWTVFSINGAILANPVTYNFQSDLGVQVIISESETIMSYDSITNKFYETIPDKSALLVITVNKINAELLETLTIEEINSYV